MLIAIKKYATERQLAAATGQLEKLNLVLKIP
jgi:hypothetical protein